MNDEQLLRFSRQIMLPDFDIAGQEKLLSAQSIIDWTGRLRLPYCHVPWRSRRW